tara:strand:- start:37 stop:309 length:273 start_codon:yes stop_codon:yes gene_type:complete
MAVIKTNGKTFLEENEKRNATSSGMINFEEDQDNLAVQMNKLTRKDLIEAKIKSLMDVQAYIDDELMRLNIVLNNIKIEESKPTEERSNV